MAGSAIVLRFVCQKCQQELTPKQPLEKQMDVVVVPLCVGCVKAAAITALRQKKAEFDETYDAIESSIIYS